MYSLVQDLDRGLKVKQKGSCNHKQKSIGRYWKIVHWFSYEEALIRIENKNEKNNNY